LKGMDVSGRCSKASFLVNICVKFHLRLVLPFFCREL